MYTILYLNRSGQRSGKVIWMERRVPAERPIMRVVRKKAAQQLFDSADFIFFSSMSIDHVGLLFAALAEMESVLKSVAKQRAGQGSSHSSFVNYLLQANLTERQVISQHIFKLRY